MSLFRSEEHLADWLKLTQYPRGVVLTLEQTWRLARAWYVDPRASTWQPRTQQQAQAVLTSVGLVGDFWQLKP